MSGEVYKTFSQLGLSLLLFLSFSPSGDTETDIDFNILEVYYSVNNELDGEYITSQLAPEYLNGTVNLTLYLWPYSEMQIISDEKGTFYCHGSEKVCQTSLIHVILKK